MVGLALSPELSVQITTAPFRVKGFSPMYSPMNAVSRSCNRNFRSPDWSVVIDAKV
jgi:hypothetical protein